MTPGDRETLLAQALAEFVDRQAADETVDVDEFCGRYAELGGELRDQIETLVSIDRMAGPAEAAEEAPRSLSGHRIVRQIGAGGMGRVYLAVDEALGRQVAIKTLAPRLAANPALHARFMHEARAMARLNHPNIARIYSLGPADEPPHFVMEYIEGPPLTEAARALPMDRRAELMRKVAVAVDFLHRQQLIHRDLKPGNILVGSDFEPKLLDFGLVLRVDDLEHRLTSPGDIVGTPNYFSPEHTHPGAVLDARSDVFALGVVSYELLTGTLPFPPKKLAEQVTEIRERDPVLPRRLNPAVPGPLQNICLKALEKDPAARYASAGEMAADLERFLAGEPVLAAPTSYARLMAGKVEQHLRELEGWRRDEILSDSEYDAFRKNYDRLIEPEDAWILQARRLSAPQVTLYLGAWVLVVGAALIVLFRYAGLHGTPAVLLAAAAAAPMAMLGVRWWPDRRRIAVAYLLAFCLLLPIGMLVAMGEYGWLTALSRGNQKLELFSKLPDFRRTTNLQMWWALALSMPAYLWLRRRTRSSVFSLVMSVMLALLCLVTLLRMGMLDWLEQDPGKTYFYLIPCAALFLALGLALERAGRPADSRYFYPLAVAFTLVAWSGVALFHAPYAEWLKTTLPWTRGQLEYLFILNAAAYFLLQALCERFPSSQMRMVARSFRFVIPGHVMTSLLLLGLEASSRWNKELTSTDLRFEARLFEVLLPAVACGFVFASIPRQMKNFFVTGLLFLAIGLVRLQQDLFKDRALWPAALLAAGLALMFTAARYAPLKRALLRWIKRT